MLVELKQETLEKSLHLCKQEKEKAEEGLHWGMYKNKEKKCRWGIKLGNLYKQEKESWRRAYTRRRIQTRTQMARGRLAPGNEYKQEKEKLEGDSHWGTYKNKKKKSWRGLTQKDL